MPKTTEPGTDSYTFGQCFELTACTDCRACTRVCPAVQAAEDESLSAPYRMRVLRRILKSRSGGLLSRLLRAKPLTPEEREAFSGTVFRCTLCGNCQQACPVGIHLKDLWLSLRRDMVGGGHYPDKIDRIRFNLEGSRNVFDEDNEERAEWVEDLDDPPDDLFMRDKAEVVYFTGCTAAFFPAAQKIPMALTRILEAAGADFTLLGEDEWCCGFPLLGAGLGDMFAQFAEHNIEAVKARGARKVVFACPSCYHMWKENYPYAEHGIEIYHSTRFVERLIAESRLPLKPLDLTVTYHDPCDLGRGSGEFDAPRAVIRSIPGVRLVELPRSRENCTCCGGGGNLEMIDADLASGIAASKIDEALSTGARAIVTSCQQCVRTMLTYVRRNKVELEVLDVNQLVLRALDE